MQFPLIWEILDQFKGLDPSARHPIRWKDVYHFTRAWHDLTGMNRTHNITIFCQASGSDNYSYLHSHVTHHGSLVALQGLLSNHTNLPVRLSQELFTRRQQHIHVSGADLHLQGSKSGQRQGKVNLGINIFMIGYQLGAPTNPTSIRLRRLVE